MIRAVFPALKTVLLSVVVPIITVNALYQSSGCGAILRQVDDVNDPHDDVVLADCHKLARDVRKDAGPEAGIRAFEACAKDGGF